MPVVFRWSAWDLLLIPATGGPFALFFWVSVVGMGRLIKFVHPEMKFWVVPHTVGGALALLGIGIAVTTPSVLMGNMLMLLIPDARRDLRQRLMGVPFGAGPGLRTALYSMSFVALVGVLVALVGALLPW